MPLNTTRNSGVTKQEVYLLFAREVGPMVKQKYPNIEKVQFNQILARIWLEMPEEERNNYQKKIENEWKFSLANMEFVQITDINDDNPRNVINPHYVPDPRNVDGPQNMLGMNIVTLQNVIDPGKVVSSQYILGSGNGFNIQSSPSSHNIQAPLVPKSLHNSSHDISQNISNKSFLKTNKSQAQNLKEISKGNHYTREPLKNDLGQIYADKMGKFRSILPKPSTSPASSTIYPSSTDLSSLKSSQTLSSSSRQSLKVSSSLGRAEEESSIPSQVSPIYTNILSSVSSPSNLTLITKEIEQEKELRRRFWNQYIPRNNLPNDNFINQRGVLVTVHNMEDIIREMPQFYHYYKSVNEFLKSTNPGLNENLLRLKALNMFNDLLSSYNGDIDLTKSVSSMRSSLPTLEKKVSQFGETTQEPKYEETQIISGDVEDISVLNCEDIEIEINAEKANQISSEKTKQSKENIKDVDAEYDEETLQIHDLPDPYSFFCEELRPITRSKYPNLDEEAVENVLARMWQAMSSGTKAKYYKLAEDRLQSSMVPNPIEDEDLETLEEADPLLVDVVDEKS